MKSERLLKILLAAATVTVPFLITACGDNELAGDDWRASGIVSDTGVITRNGEDIKVCLCVYDDNVSIYHDKKEQEFIEAADFPREIADAHDSYSGAHFDDINGDGESDLQIDLWYGEGSYDILVWYWDPSTECYVYLPDESTIGYEEVKSSEEYLADYIGLWEYHDENIWIRINADASWELLNSGAEVVESGTAVADEERITLHFDDGGDTWEFVKTVSEDLIDSVNGGVLTPVEAIVAKSNKSFFEENRLDLNAERDSGTVLLKNGVCSYRVNGEGYTLGDAYWEVVTKSDDVHDGIREIQFDAICYVPEDSIPLFISEFSTVVGSELFDYHTGMWFTASSTYGDNTRGENHYLHTVNYDGVDYDIEFFYSTEWDYDNADWNTVLTKSYIVYLPEDYDGLIFAALAMPKTYKESAARQQLDLISPEALITECATIDPSANLYFDITKRG